MIPAAFDYVRARSLDDALATNAKLAEGALLIDVRAADKATDLLATAKNVPAADWDAHQADFDKLTGGDKAKGVVLYSDDGADAVAGVVNFIMQRDFEGVRLDAQYGIYQHKNDNPIADVVRASAAANKRRPRSSSFEPTASHRCRMASASIMRPTYARSPLNGIPKT